LGNFVVTQLACVLKTSVAQPEWGRKGHGPPKQTC